MFIIIHRTILEYYPYTFLSPINVKKNRSLNIFFSCDFLIPRRFIMVLKRVFIYISRFNTEKIEILFYTLIIDQLS